MKTKIKDLCYTGGPASDRVAWTIVWPGGDETFYRTAYNGTGIYVRGEADQYTLLQQFANVDFSRSKLCLTTVRKHIKKLLIERDQQPND